MDENEQNETPEQEPAEHLQVHHDVVPDPNVTNTEEPEPAEGTIVSEESQTKTDEEEVASQEPTSRPDEVA